MSTNTETAGESLIKFEPFRYCGGSLDSILIAHAYRKYVRCNPNATTQVSAHGGTSKYAQWKLHAMSKDIFKLQNGKSGKYLRIIKNGTTVDVGGGGGKYTLFKAHQSHQSPMANDMSQPHQISLESVEFPGNYIAVDSQCNVYSYGNNPKQNRNDISLYLYARPSVQSYNNYEQKEKETVLKGGIVVIQHGLNRHLRVKPGNEVNLNAEGGRGRFARWELEIHGDNLVKFKSTKSGRFLRIIKGGTVCNVGGGGGQYTLFKYNPKTKTLESNKFAGFYLAMNKNNKSEVFAVNKAMNENGDYFYKFNVIPINVPISDKNDGNIVVVQHSFGKSLRVKPGMETEINGNGHRGKFARWKIEYFDEKTKIKLKSTKSGKYLRIIKNGTAVDVGGSGGKFTLFRWNPLEKTMESNNFPGFFLATNQNSNTVQSVQPNSVANDMNISMKFEIIPVGNGHGRHGRHGGHGGHGHGHHRRMHRRAFSAKYDFMSDKCGAEIVVVRSLANDKSLRVNPTNVDISNGLGGFGGYARWQISRHGNMVYKLQSTNSNRFIRVSPKNNGCEVDVRGSGGKFTEWRVHIVREGNCVLFESVQFPNTYLGCDKSGNVYAYRDSDNMAVRNNSDCLWNVWQKGNDYGSGQCGDKDRIIMNQQSLIDQQKAFIDQLQRTVSAQQQIIDNSGGNVQRNRNASDNTQVNDGEYEDGFEYVHGPGTTKK